MTLLALLACSPPATAPKGAAVETGLPPDTDAAAAIDVDLAEAGAAVQRALDLLPVMRAQPMIEAYVHLMKDIEPDCPNYTETEGGSHFWDGACSTSAGAYYHGAAFYYRVTESPLTGGALGGLSTFVPVQLISDEVTLSGQGLFGQVDSATKEGDAFRCSCRAVALYGYDARTTEMVWYNHTYGPITWTGESAAASWLGTEQRAHLSQFARYVPSSGRKARSVEGIVNGLAAPYTSVELALDLTVDGADPCAKEPVGTVAVRDQVTGYWIQVAMDVEADTPGSDPRCDGCGEASLNGAPLGTVCADFTTMYDYADAPW